MELTYPEVLASRDEPMPSGYNHLRHSASIGRGPQALSLAAHALMSFEMHRRVGVRIRETQVVQGASVRQRLLWIDAPIRIVWVGEAGFGIGTLTGHPETGEESFLLELDGDGTVWLEVRSFSRPARWFTRLAGPLMPVLQRAFARRCAGVLRNIVQNGGKGAPEPLA